MSIYNVECRFLLMSKPLQMFSYVRYPFFGAFCYGYITRVQLSLTCKNCFLSRTIYHHPLMLLLLSFFLHTSSLLHPSQRSQGHYKAKGVSRVDGFEAHEGTARGRGEGGNVYCTGRKSRLASAA